MRACWDATLLVLVQPSPASCATCRGTSDVPRVLALTHRHLRKSPSVRQPFAEISGSISFSPPVVPFPETVPNFVCHFKGSLHFVQVLSNAIERLKGSPTSPDPKRVFRTVVSELARAYLVPASQLSHANRPERKITPGILAGLVQQVSTGGPNERVVQYHHARSNSVPKNSLQRRAIPQSLHQCGGDICAHPATCRCSIYTRGELRCVTIRFALWCRWVWLRLR